MLKQAFIGAFAPFARAPAPGAPGAGFAAPANFEWRMAVTALVRLGRGVARTLAPRPASARPRSRRHRDRQGSWYGTVPRGRGVKSRTRMPARAPRGIVCGIVRRGRRRVP